jgi:hypothetical protein
MQRSEIKETLFPPRLTEDQRLTIETCPGFNRTLDRALEPYNYREPIRCGDCRLRVEVLPLARRVFVSGECPKL